MRATVLGRRESSGGQEHLPRISPRSNAVGGFLLIRNRLFGSRDFLMIPLVQPAIFLLMLGAIAFGKDKSLPAGLIELGGKHFVLSGESESADGRFAVGWT